MEITDIQIRILKKSENRLKAIASVVIDNCFVVHDIKIISGTDDVFIAMPSRKTIEGDFKDVAHPIDSETRKIFCNAIIAEYNKVLKEYNESKN